MKEIIETHIKDSGNKGLISISCDGQVDTHIMGAVGDYATICGLDGDDEYINQSIVDSVSDEVDCSLCQAIWAKCRKIKPSQIGEDVNA